ncbi:MAG: phosphatidylinositol mannoside acyltransferase [Actinomycetales bacterium]|nr:phosphatidylinositol mannoside acyltransferase [Actinomycetales bacterium]
MKIDTGRLFAFAWDVVHRLPDALARGIFDAVAIVAHTARIGSVRQLEANLARVRPELDARGLRRLSRSGMRSYLRYYCESFQLPGMSEAQVDARVRVIGHEQIVAELQAGRSVVAGLGHTGNWDLGAAWFTRHVGRTVTVAEKLEPEQLFREFLAFREGLGLVIVPYQKGSGVLRRLISEAKRTPAFIPLLADRDLSTSGLEVQVNGHGMRVAPGPAALALATRSMLLPVSLHYERITGERRRRAGSPWGVVMQFHAPVAVPDEPREEALLTMTQAWVDPVAASVSRHPQDWHMLQKVFTADLDHDRLARSRTAEELAP